MKNIIIGFSGACHSGKTQLFNKLKQYNSPFVEFLPEMIRENIKENESIEDIRKDPNRFLNMQDNIFRFNLKNIIEKNNDEGKLIISDRTLIDNLYYTLIYLDRTCDNLNWDKHNKLWKDMLDVANNIESYYSKIFFFKPIIFNSENDKVRVKNLKSIQNLEYNTFRMLHHKNINNNKSVYNSDSFIIDFDVIKFDKEYTNSLVGICNYLKEYCFDFSNDQMKLLRYIIEEQKIKR